MDQNLENKFSFKNKIVNFYNFNKNKIYIFSVILILALISFTYIIIINERKNIKVAERYIKAGIYLSSDKKDNAKDIFEEIILSKNEFYSILALNTLIEKNLITDKKKIIDYFSILEKSTFTNEAEDIIALKKALYLIKEKDTQKGENLLKGLIEKNSHLKSIAQEILKK